MKYLYGAMTIGLLIIVVHINGVRYHLNDYPHEWFVGAQSHHRLDRF